MANMLHIQSEHEGMNNPNFFGFGLITMNKIMYQAIL